MDRPFFILAILSLCLVGGFAHSPVLAIEPGEDCTWIVLSNEENPRMEPKTAAKRLGKILKFGERYSGRLLETDKRKWVELDIEGESVYVPEIFVVEEVEAPEINLPIGEEVVDRWHPISQDYHPTDLVPLGAQWSYQAQSKHQLRRQAAQAAERLLKDAKKAGLQLRVASAYRAPAQQRIGYLKTIKRDGWGQNTVAKPGHSEHHLGTTLDLTNLDPKKLLVESFGETPEGIWLKANASRYGFRLSYTRENTDVTGYAPEPWHIRYMGRFGSALPTK
jgi:D-alanyl-D-alanine carboxypeptidase